MKHSRLLPYFNTGDDTEDIFVLCASDSDLQSGIYLDVFIGWKKINISYRGQLLSWLFYFQDTYIKKMSIQIEDDVTQQSKKPQNPRQNRTFENLEWSVIN